MKMYNLTDKKMFVQCVRNMVTGVFDIIGSLIKIVDGVSLLVTLGCWQPGLGFKWEYYRLCETKF